MSRPCNAPQSRDRLSPPGLEFHVCPAWFADVVEGTSKFAARVEAIGNAADRYGLEVITDCCAHPAADLVRGLVLEDTELIFASSRGAQPAPTPLHDALISRADGVSVRTALAIMTQQDLCAARDNCCAGCG